MNVKARRRVPLTAEQVWATLSNHTGMSTWSPGISVTMERGGDVDYNGVGAVRRVAGMGPVIREEITEFDAPNRIAYRALSGIPLRDYRGVVTIQPRNGVPGSLVTWEISTTTESRAARVLLAVLCRVFLSSLLRTANKNKSKLEVVL